MAHGEEQHKCECYEAYRDIEKVIEQHAGDPDLWSRYCTTHRNVSGTCPGTFRSGSRKTWSIAC